MDNTTLPRISDWLFIPLKSKIMGPVDLKSTGLAGDCHKDYLTAELLKFSTFAITIDQLQQFDILWPSNFSRKISSKWFWRWILCSYISPDAVTDLSEKWGVWRGRVSGKVRDTRHHQKEYSPSILCTKNIPYHLLWETTAKSSFRKPNLIFLLSS